MSNSDATESEEKVGAELRGNTLRVYLHALKSGDRIGVREVQRALGFSSPTLAAYHLNKLVDMGLLENKCGEYLLVKEVKVGVLRQFVKVGAFLLPRQVFYAVLFTTLMILYSVYLFNFERLSLSSVFALAFGTLGLLTSWYETLRSWREKP